MQINTGRMYALMRRNGMSAEADALENGERTVGSICEIMGLDRPAASMVQELPPSQREPGSCTSGIPGNIPGIGAWPACYKCKTLDPCLLPYLQDQALTFDAWSLLELYKNESDLVHFNSFVGAAPFVAPAALAANKASLLAQEVGQQLAYIPGLLKVSAKFSDAKDHQADLGLTIYVGPRGLTGLTTTDGLIQVGKPFTFEDFVCGTACYLAPFPDLYGCSNRVIPGPRSLYVKVSAGALPDGVTVESLSVVVIKAGTVQFANCCNQNNIVGVN